jgi:hypothetical protein
MHSSKSPPFKYTFLPSPPSLKNTFGKYFFNVLWAMCNFSATTGTKCYVLEEVLVVEQHFSRYLKEFEVVHHINGDIDDNSIQNLRLFENYQARNTQLSPSYLFFLPLQSLSDMEQIMLQFLFL